MRATAVLCLILFAAVAAKSFYRHSRSPPAEDLAISYTAEESNDIENKNNDETVTEPGKVETDPLEAKEISKVKITENKSVTKKNGNIYIADCYLSNMKPGEVKTKMISSNTENTPDNENIYILSDDSGTERLPTQMFINNINRYNLTIRKDSDYDHCIVADAPCWPRITRLVAIYATDISSTVEEGNVPPYTTMGENWNIYVVDCDTKLGEMTTEVTDKVTERPPNPSMHILTTNRYNISIRNVNDYDHCIIKDTACWPKKKRFIEIKAMNNKE